MYYNCGTAVAKCLPMQACKKLCCDVSFSVTWAIFLLWRANFGMGELGTSNSVYTLILLSTSARVTNYPQTKFVWGYVTYWSFGN